MSDGATATARTLARVDRPGRPDRPARRRARDARAPARRRCGASSPRSGALGHARRARRRRHGRLGDRRRAGARGARRPRLATDLRRPRLRPAAWTTPDTTVLCASYSGNTEETLACYEAAGALGASASSSPPAAARRAGARRRRAGDPAARRLPAARGRRLHDRRRARGRRAVRRRAAADVRDRRRRRARSSSSSTSGARTGPRTRWPRSSPAGCTARSPVIDGAGLTAPIAYRWKTQINENAKARASAHELPELDHNEIAGWEGAPSSAASPPCSSTTPTCTRASGSASS